MFAYAQINEEGRAVGVSQLSGQVEAANMIALPAYDESVIGKRWTGAGWEAMPAERAAVSRLNFRERFTTEEKRAIYAAARENIDVQIWMDDLASTPEVFTDDPRTIRGVNGLEAAGLIGPGRAAEILA